MSKTPVLISGVANVRVASHLSNVPFIATDAFTSNLILLSTGVIAKTGACAWLADGSTVDATRHRMVSCTNYLLGHEDSDKASPIQAGCQRGTPRPTVKSHRPLGSVKKDGD